MIEALNRYIQPLKDRVMLMVSRAVIKTVMDDKKMQLVKVSMFADENADNIERMQNFGFTSNPPLNSEGIVVFPGGNREHGIMIACDDRATRPVSLAPGEAMIYTKDGTKLHLKLGGKLKVNNASNEMITNLSDFMGAVIAAKVITGIGPQRFVATDITAMTDEKTKFDTFKE